MNNLQEIPMKSFWGLYDMHGDVWEYVHNMYHDTYQSAPPDGSAREGNATNRIIQGGSSTITMGTSA